MCIILYTMEYAVVNYKNINGDLSQTLIQCFDEFEGYKFKSHQFTIGEPFAQSIIPDFSTVVTHFVTQDMYDEWVIARLLMKPNGTYEITHEEEQDVTEEREVPVVDENGDPVLDENGDATYEMQSFTVRKNVTVVDEVINNYAMHMTMLSQVLSGATKKDIVLTKDLPDKVERAAINIWSFLENDAEVAKNNLKSQEEERKRLIDEGRGE